MFWLCPFITILQSQHRHVLDILFVRDLQHAPVSFSCCFAVWLILHAPAMPSGFRQYWKACVHQGRLSHV